MTLHEAARQYIGTPWRHLGRTRRGLDCGGLPIIAFADMGVKIDAPERYGRDPFQNGLLDAVTANMGEPVWKGNKGRCTFEVLEPDDVVVMAPASLPRHLAIVAPDEMYGLSLIHADGSPGVKKVVEHGLNNFYLKMIVSVFRRSAQ